MTFTGLDQQDALFRSMFDHATVGIIMVDEAGQIFQVNNFANEIFGYQEDELIGEKVEILVPQGRHHQHEKYRDEYFERPRPRPMGVGRELYGVRKDGLKFPIEISLSHAVHENKKVAIAFISDTSQRKGMLASLRENERKLQEYSDRLEQKVIERTHELTASEKRLKEAQRMAGLGYWEYDLTNKTLSASEVLFNIFDMSRADGASLEVFLDLIHPEDFPLAKDLVKAAITTGKRSEYNYRVLMPSGEIRYIQGYIERELDRANQIVKLFGVTQDVTTYKRAETQLGNSLSRERELGELKSRFVAMASHEFRTPLTSILSSTDLIELHAEKMNSAKFARHTKRIKASVDNLTAILNDFLSLEKLESGKVIYTPVALELPEFFREVVEDIHLSQSDRERILVTHTGAATVQLDAQLMRNILINLLSNAVKYAPGESPITIASNHTERLLTIEVKDRGIGIPAADQANMFNRFFRASNAESIKGTGLGLNIVKRYLDIMRGSIDFQSEEGKGTTFRIRIPQ